MVFHGPRPLHQASAHHLPSPAIALPLMASHGPRPLLQASAHHLPLPATDLPPRQPTTDPLVGSAAFALEVAPARTHHLAATIATSPHPQPAYHIVRAARSADHHIAPSTTLQVASRPGRVSTAPHKASRNTHGDSSRSNQTPKTPLADERSRAYLRQAMSDDKACKCDHRLLWLHDRQRDRLWKRKKRTWVRRTDRLLAVFRLYFLFYLRFSISGLSATLRAFIDSSDRRQMEETPLQWGLGWDWFRIGNFCFVVSLAYQLTGRPCFVYRSCGFKVHITYIYASARE